MFENRVDAMNWKFQHLWLLQMMICVRMYDLIVFENKEKV